MGRRNIFRVVFNLFNFRLFIIWNCLCVNNLDAQGIRGMFVNNRMVDNSGKVNFIYPTGYTAIRVGTPLVRKRVKVFMFYCEFVFMVNCAELS